MRGYVAFTRKEFIENARNYRLLMMLSLFFFFGLLNPLTAKFTPELLSLLAPEFQEVLPPPVAMDSWVQFYKNVSSLGFSLAIILFSTMLSSEYAKGTLAIMLTKGLSRPAVILAKFTVATAIMTVSMWMCYGITYGYTAFFWHGEALSRTVFAAFALWICGILYVSIIMLGCVLFRQAFTAILFLLGTTTVISLLGMLDIFKNISPMILTTKNVDYISGAIGMSEFTIPIVIALVISAVCLVASIALFDKKEI